MLRVKERKKESSKKSICRYQHHNSMTRLPAGSRKAYFKQIEQVLQKKEKTPADYDVLQQFFSQNHITYLSDLKSNLSEQQYNQFLDHLKLSFIQQGVRVVEKGRKIRKLFIILEGRVSFNQEKVNEGKLQIIKVYMAKVGELVGPCSLQPPKYSSYMIMAEKPCVCLEFDEQTFNKYLKKVHHKEQQEFVQSMSQSGLFRGVGVVSLRKYLPSFFLKSYKHHQIIYKEGDLESAIYFILEGEVDIKKKMGQEQIKIVRLGSKEFFGVDGKQNPFDKPLSYYSQTASFQAKILYIQGRIFNKICSDNALVSENLHAYLEKMSNMHSVILQRNQSVLKNQNNILNLINKKRKKKRIGKRLGQKASLEWWGLASKYMESKRYRLPDKPLSQSYSLRKRDQPSGDFDAQRKNINRQMEEFRKRVFQAEMNCFTEEMEDNDSDGENHSPFKQDYMPKMRKIKIQMIDTKPKAINTAQKTKKKLVSYAKSGGNFCDRLNLQ